MTYTADMERIYREAMPSIREAHKRDEYHRDGVKVGLVTGFLFGTVLYGLLYWLSGMMYR